VKGKLREHLAKKKSRGEQSSPFWGGGRIEIRITNSGLPRGTTCGGGNLREKGRAFINCQEDGEGGGNKYGKIYPETGGGRFIKRGDSGSPTPKKVICCITQKTGTT